MSKEIGTIRPGTAIKAKIGDRIRHAIVTEVTDQDNVEVRIGGAGNPLSALDLAVSRQASTETRGSLFED
jgi:sRNA-binding protein